MAFAMRGRGRLVLVAAFLATASCVAHDTDRCIDVLAGVPVSGRDEFLRACASCHGVDGRGGGTVAAELRTPPPDLTTLGARAGGRFPRERVIGVLNGDIPIGAHGSRDMPVWSERFAPSDFAATAAASIYARRWLEALASHVASIQRPEAAATRPAR